MTASLGKVREKPPQALWEISVALRSVQKSGRWHWVRSAEFSAGVCWLHRWRQSEVLGGIIGGYFGGDAAEELVELMY